LFAIGLERQHFVYILLTYYHRRMSHGAGWLQPSFPQSDKSHNFSAKC